MKIKVPRAKAVAVGIRSCVARRSGAWVLPFNGMDQASLDFVNACPVKTKICLEEDRPGSRVREFMLVADSLFAEGAADTHDRRDLPASVRWA
jgi:hypothetical protein